MKADVNKLGYVGAKPGAVVASVRDANAWFTPSKYVDMARDVMGEIDLDPFSSSSANTRIQAKRFFDTDDDAHKQIWFETRGRVFMNPPYGRGDMAKAVKTFLEIYSKGQISESIVLVNNSTETKWFQDLLEQSSALCFTNKRISFENDDGKNISSNTRGQAFIYFGNNTKRFHEVFQSIGRTVENHLKPTIH